MTKFLLLLGPSGVGKSTIIRTLRDRDPRFVYVSPYITRALRDGEQDKISISPVEMDAMAARGDFLKINELYGVRYATPKKPILDAFDAGKFPILDWPAHEIQTMVDAFGRERLFVSYIAPPSENSLRQRLGNDDRDRDGSRLRAALDELQRLHAGNFDALLDLRIVSAEGKSDEAANELYEAYLSSL